MMWCDWRNQIIKTQIDKCSSCPRIRQKMALCFFGFGSSYFTLFFFQLSIPQYITWNCSQRKLIFPLSVPLAYSLNSANPSLSFFLGRSRKESWWARPQGLYSLLYTPGRWWKRELQPRVAVFPTVRSQLCDGQDRTKDVRLCLNS